MSGKKDWIGHKFSNFEVIAFDEKSYKKDTERVKNGEIKRFNRKYLCRCNCENIVSVTANNIKRGTPNSCGCIRNLTAEDLNGQNFGDWTVLSRNVEKTNEDVLNGKTYQVYWDCICKCGNKSTVSYSHLKSGASTKCKMCASKKLSFTKIKDLSGKTYGNLTTICINEKLSNKNRGTFWECKCSCGNIESFHIDTLTSGRNICCSECKCEGFDSVKSKSNFYKNMKKIKEHGSLYDTFIERYSNEEIKMFWSKNNKFSSKQFTKKSHQDIFLICPTCGKEYKTNALCLYSRVNEIQCSSCFQNENCSSLQKEVKNFLNIKLHLETLHESYCNLLPINPKTKCRLFYDNEIPSLKIIVEVMGIQHYKELDDNCTWLNGVTPKKFLKDLQWRDQYKKEYAISCGYRYIDLKYSEIQDKSYKNKLIKFIKEGEKDECNTKNNEHITRNGL